MTMRLYRALIWLTLVGALMTTGCQTNKKDGGSHAAAEITGHSLDAVRSTTVTVFAEAGYTVRTSLTNQLVFDRPASTAEKIKYGDWINDGMLMLVKVQLELNPGDVCSVRADAYAVQDPKDVLFRTEKRLGTLSGRGYQKLLDEVRLRLQGFPPE